MEIVLKRYHCRKWGVDGELFINGRKVCDTVEHPQYCKPVGVSVVTKEHNPFVHGDGALACRKGEIVVGKWLMAGMVTESSKVHWTLYERLRKAWRKGNEIILTIIEVDGK